MKQTQKLTTYLDKIESFIPQFEKQNPNISQSTIGWQIDHRLKVINGVISMLKAASIDKRPSVTFFGKLCLFFNFIPRGRGKAPDQVLPPKIIKRDALIGQLETAKKLITELPNISEKATFKHLYFGILSKKQTVRFIEVHTKHHLKIIDDVLKK